MSTELSTETQHKLTPVAMSGKGVQFTSMDELGRFCLAVKQSGLAPKGFDTPQAIMVAIQLGLEIGLAPMQALQNIAIINGRPSVWGDAALALVKSRPDCEDVIETIGEESATCEVRRKGQQPVKRTFTLSDAQKAGLKGKAGPWTQYTKRMLQMRARAWALRDSFPDALKGVGIVEENNDIPTTKVANAREVATGIVLPDEPPRLEAPKEEAPPEKPAPKPKKEKPKPAEQQEPPQQEEKRDADGNVIF